MSKPVVTPGDVPVYNSSNGRTTQTHLLKVEWQGTQHGSRVKLSGDLLCMAAWLQKSRGHKLHGLLYWAESGKRHMHRHTPPARNSK